MSFIKNVEGLKKWVAIVMMVSMITMLFAGVAAAEEEEDRPWEAEPGTITFAADADYELYFNGKLIGEGDSWKEAKEYRLDVEKGRNIVAVKAKDNGEFAGILAELNLADRTLFSDFNWKVSAAYEEGWEQQSFDDHLWRRANDFGRYGIAPWHKDISGMPEDTDAKWLWIGSSNYNTMVDEVYFRFEFAVQRDGTFIPNPKETSGAFENVRYELHEDVIAMPAGLSDKIASANDFFEDAPEEGSFTLSAAEYRGMGLRLQPGQVYVDEGTGKAIKVAEYAYDRGTGQHFVRYALPEVNEVFDHVDIPEQTVSLEDHNLFVPRDPNPIPGPDRGMMLYSFGAAAPAVSNFSGSSGVSCKSSSGKYTCTIDKVLLNHGSGNNKVFVKANGEVTFQSPKVTTSFNRKDYNVKFTAGETANIKITGEAKFHKEIKYPIVGFEVKAGSLVALKGGIFMVVGVDGSVTFEFQVDQGYKVEAGIKGKSWWYIPETFTPYSKVERWFQTSYKVEGHIKTWAGVKAEVGLKIIGKNIADVSAFAGLEGNGKWSASPGNLNMKLTLDALVKGDAKVLKKSYKLFEFRWNLYTLENKSKAVGTPVPSEYTAPWLGAGSSFAPREGKPSHSAA